MEVMTEPNWLDRQIETALAALEREPPDRRQLYEAIAREKLFGRPDEERK